MIASCFGVNSIIFQAKKISRENIERCLQFEKSDKEKKAVKKKVSQIRAKKRRERGRERIKKERVISPRGIGASERFWKRKGNRVKSLIFRIKLDIFC